jgi:antitoxin component YwqK of YwqJK toxin-antitoxin module
MGSKKGFLWQGDIIFSVIIIIIGKFITKDRMKNVKKYYSDNILKSLESYLIVYFGKNVLHGQSKYFDENGKIKSILEYDNGRLNGIQFYYDSKGKLIKKEIYKEGIFITEITIT